MQFNHDEVLIYGCFFFRVYRLKQTELVTGLGGGKAFDPFVSKTFQFLCSLGVLDHNPIVVRVDVGDKDVYCYHALLYLVGTACRECHNGILFLAVTRSESVPINLSRNRRGEGACSEHSANIALYLLACLCHT